jgi:chemotaxis protein MotB
MAKNNNENRPIIIKKVVEEEGHGHHGGAWKVAYADFVTAMMAFFLLLWILNAVQEESLEGIADYFTPTVVPQAGLGGDGLLDGGTVGPDGTLNSSNSPFMTIATPRFGEDDPGQDPNSDISNEKVVVEYEEKSSENATIDEEKIDEILEQINKERLKNVQSQIVQAMQSVPDLKPLIPNVLFEETPEGLRIQIVDQEGKDMFPSGSTEMYDETKDIISLVGKAVSQLPNSLIITGHTDAVPYSNRKDYSNWELSADRANATRRVIIDSGVQPQRIARVSGVAQYDPLVKSDPFDPSNRRISIVLSYGTNEADIDRNIINNQPSVENQNVEDTTNPPSKETNDSNNSDVELNSNNDYNNEPRRDSISLDELRNAQ